MSAIQEHKRFMAQVDAMARADYNSMMAEAIVLAQKASEDAENHEYTRIQQ